jgi:ribosomal protein S18 acetylase RimI-like enzyme
VVGLVHEAGNPYFDWFFGGAEQAAATLAAWVNRPSSEVWLERIALALLGGEAVGMYVALPGQELHHCRQEDTLALLKTVGHDAAARAALHDRIEVSKDLFAPVGAVEFYLSKMGVVPAHRGKGLGRVLANAFLAAGHAAGFSRFRLDVSADNEPAVRLYASCGFRVESESEAAGLRYLAMGRGA